MRAKLTTIGLYNYDNTLFDGLQLPAGSNRDNAINMILLEDGEFSVLYPDLDFLKSAIASWSAAMLPAFNRYWDVLQIEYNPLENYDREETWTETGSGEKSTGRTASGTQNNGGTRTETPNVTNTKSTPPYNTESLTTREQNTQTGTVRTDDNYSTSTTDQETGTEETSTEGRRQGRIHGNIGVTTSQQMLISELDIAEYNFYVWLAGKYREQFCIMTY